jgi:ABC-type polysaccharide/polyol phosphate transport system ATPase subunit
MAPVVVAEDLHLEFEVQRQMSTGLRGQFIKLFSSPIKTMLEKNELLRALDGINFEAYNGDRIALVGRNGAGKSTLCRVLTGIYKPTRGKVETRGTVRSIIDPAATVFPDLTGRENARLLMGLLYPDLREEFEDYLQEVLEFSGLGNFLDTPFRHYSNGMQTRLCLSVATCRPANIFILDEVFDGADQEFRARVSKRMLQLIEKSGVVFFVSHSESQVRNICNKALLLHEGKVLEFGAVENIFESYTKLSK